MTEVSQVETAEQKGLKKIKMKDFNIYLPENEEIFRQFLLGWKPGGYEYNPPSESGMSFVFPKIVDGEKWRFSLNRDHSLKRDVASFYSPDGKVRLPDVSALVFNYGENQINIISSKHRLEYRISEGGSRHTLLLFDKDRTQVADFRVPKPQ